MFTRLRVLIDYLCYLTFLQVQETVRLILDAGVFILSLFLLRYELLSDDGHGFSLKALTIIPILLLLRFLWETYHFTDEIKSYFRIRNAALCDDEIPRDILPSVKEEQMDFEVVKFSADPAEAVLYSRRVNKFIRTTPLRLSLSRRRSVKVQAHIRDHEEAAKEFLNHFVLDALRHGRMFFNEPKLCLSEDIIPGTPSVACHTAGYYDSFLTNEISGRYLKTGENGKTVITSRYVFPAIKDRKGDMRLLDLEHSQMNNHIGCSTIGITADGYMLLWRQGEKTQFNRGRLVPTGSGSCNPSDLAGHNFSATIIRAMERELREESTPERKEGEYKTKILGFFRWIQRGGKPEFIGITRLPGMMRDYKPNPQEMKNSSHSYRAEYIDSIPGLLDTVRHLKRHHKLSVPLHACLKALEEYAHTNKKELEYFIFN